MFNEAKLKQEKIIDFNVDAPTSFDFLSRLEKLKKVDADINMLKDTGL